ncbi:MAG: hypothetical protein H0U59_02195 [Gemmatimonadaceae bacterium]|nr:hypothetical protein [Gemmatimonadaceae bacterium]
MKAIRFLPLVYIVGIDGFVFFAPYLLLLLTLAYTVRLLRLEQARALVIAIPIRPRLSTLWHTRPRL